MDWIIWVIVIVLVIAIVWWLMNRNKANNSSSTHAPAAMEPANTASLPDPAAATAGVAGLAGVTNLGRDAAEGSGPTGEEPPREPAREAAGESISDEPAEAKAHRDQETADTSIRDRDPEPVSPLGDVRDSPQQTSPDPQRPATPGLTVEEPVVAVPVVEEPVVEEPVVAQPTVDATVHSADAAPSPADAAPSPADAAPSPADAAPSPADAAPSPADAAPSADAGDVDDWEAGDSEPAGRNDAADKAEWESSWTDPSGAPVHHHEYTDAHSPTLPGAESAAAEDPANAGHLAAEHPYGTGSSSTPGSDYPVKADATAMTYHDEDTAGYDEVPADVWFESAAHAEAAGFRPPRRNRH